VEGLGEDPEDEEGGEKDQEDQPPVPPKGLFLVDDPIEAVVAEEQAVQVDPQPKRKKAPNFIFGRRKETP
jgi:hypothetical protein